MSWCAQEYVKFQSQQQSTIFWCILKLTIYSFTGNWSPALQIRTILLSIQALLGAPNPDDPLAPDVAKRWKEDEPAAIATAKEWTRTHAMTWSPVRDVIQPRWCKWWKELWEANWIPTNIPNSRRRRELGITWLMFHLWRWHGLAFHEIEVR